MLHVWRVLRAARVQRPAGSKARMSEIVVYTAVTADRDKLRDPANPLPGVDYVCFSDAPIESSVWRVVRIATGEHPRLTAQRYRALSHVYLGAYRYAIWHDASMVATDRVRGAIDALGDADIAACRHRWRNCLYEEGPACVEAKRERADVVAAQLGRYRRLGFPPGLGLFELGLLVRRHGPAVEVFNSLWWSEMSSQSARAQLSFTYVAWRTGTTVRPLPGTVDRNDFVDFDMDEHRRRFVPVG